MSYSGVLCLLGIRKVHHELRSEAVEVVQDAPCFGFFGRSKGWEKLEISGDTAQEEGIQHVIVIANYKEVGKVVTNTQLAQFAAVGFTPPTAQKMWPSRLHVAATYAPYAHS